MIEGLFYFTNRVGGCFLFVLKLRGFSWVRQEDLVGQLRGRSFLFLVLSFSSEAFFATFSVNCNFFAYETISLMQAPIHHQIWHIHCSYAWAQSEWLIDRKFPYIEHSIIFGSWAKYEKIYSFSFCPCAAPQREFTLKPCHLPFRCWKHFCFAGGMGGGERGQWSDVF